MSRLDSAFAARPALMPYYPLGYPDIETSVHVIEALARNGADAIEVGLPFSDPLADGPVIQRATQIALEHGMTVARAVECVSELRRRGVSIPLVLMSYYNPLMAYGLERVAHVGADGFIVPDLPLEESSDFEALLNGTPLIRMMAPTTSSERLRAIAKGARGFLYLVSLTGVTGARTALPEGLPEFVERVRAQSTTPICVGFGISTPEQARAVGQIADGVIIGSACIKAIGEAADPARAAANFARTFKSALSTA